MRQTVEITLSFCRALIHLYSRGGGGGGGGAERAWPPIYHSRRPEKDYKIMSCTYDVLATHPIATHHRCGVLVDNGELVQVHTHV